MTVETINGTIKLTAGTDKVLTNGEAFSDVNGSILLGCNDKPENWCEITAEEHKRIQAKLIPEGGNG